MKFCSHNPQHQFCRAKAELIGKRVVINAKALEKFCDANPDKCHRRVSPSKPLKVISKKDWSKIFGKN